MKAVLTADIVNSTNLSSNALAKLVESLKSFFQEDTIAFHRGDSFQVLMDEVGQAYKKTVQARMLAKSTAQTDIRFAISIGRLHQPVKDIGSSMESVMVRSGRAFDEFKKLPQRRLLITYGKPQQDLAYELIADYTDFILRKVTAKQAAVMYIALQGIKQIAIAEQLKLSAATVSQHISAGGFEEITFLNDKFEQLTGLLENDR